MIIAVASISPLAGIVFGGMYMSDSTLEDVALLILITGAGASFGAAVGSPIALLIGASINSMRLRRARRT